MHKLIKILFLLFFASVVTHAAGGITGGIQDDLTSQISRFYPTFQAAAKGLLYSLGVISLVITFGLMAVRGELEIGGAAAQLIKYALIIGFFSMLIGSPTWLVNMSNSLSAMGKTAGGIGTLEDAFNNLRALWAVYWSYDFEFTEMANSIALFFVMLVVSAIIFIMIGTALTTYAFFLLSVYVGVFWLGFGSFEQTRPWAINAISNVVRNGMKWVMSMLIISIAMSSVINLNQSLFAAKGLVDFTLWFDFLGITLVFYSVNSGINSWVDSYFTGSGGGENSKGGQFVQSAMNAGAGAVVGATVGASKGFSDTMAAAKADGKSAGSAFMSAMGGGLAGGLSGGAKGGIHGGDSFASNWAKSSDPNYSLNSDEKKFGSTPPSPPSQKTPVDGDAGGGLSGSIAEPKVGGEINKNQY